jgi:hypothetical protein
MFSGLCLKADARRLWLDRFSVFDFFLVQNLQLTNRDYSLRAQRRCGMVVVRWPMVGWFEALDDWGENVYLTRSRHLIDGSLSLDGFRSGWMAATVALVP